MFSALAISAFIASALVLVPLPWHLRARNIATLSIILWLFILNLTYGANAVIWAGNADIAAPVWCDIVTKIKIGATFALPSSCLCLALQLYAIASSLRTTTRGRRGAILDFTLCFGLPIIIMVLHYIVQGHRFDIFEDFGCRPAIYISLASLFLVDLPPIVAALLALVYCAMALFHFFRRRIAFTRTMEASDSGLTTSRYIRLMSMTMVLGTWNAIIISISTWATYGEGLRPWTSWSDVHFNFSRIQPYTIASIPQSILRLTSLLWAAVPISSLFFFFFFAFGNDAMKEYRHLFRWINKSVRRNSSTRVTSEIGPMDGSETDTTSERRLQDQTYVRGYNLQSPRSPYSSRPDSSSATFTSNGTLLRLSPTITTQEQFYGDYEQEFWAV
ncbi:Rcb2.42 [Mycena vitilis]|nr:Rcb2.42 [Mycena vitilis]